MLINGVLDCHLFSYNCYQSQFHVCLKLNKCLFIYFLISSISGRMSCYSFFEIFMEAFKQVFNGIYMFQGLHTSFTYILDEFFSEKWLPKTTFFEVFKGRKWVMISNIFWAFLSRFKAINLLEMK